MHKTEFSTTMNNHISATISALQFDGTLTAILDGGGTVTKIIKTCLYGDIVLEEDTDEDEYEFYVGHKMEVIIHHYLSGYDHTHLQLIALDEWGEERLISEAWDSYRVSDDRTVTQACINVSKVPDGLYTLVVTHGGAVAHTQVVLVKH